MLTYHSIPEVVVEVLQEDPLGWLHVPCPDFDTFKTLPYMVQYGPHEFKQYTRRGWNSDTGVAYYEPGSARVAFAYNPDERKELN
jgi:hypothetical protein